MRLSPAVMLLAAATAFATLTTASRGTCSCYAYYLVALKDNSVFCRQSRVYGMAQRYMVDASLGCVVRCLISLSSKTSGNPGQESLGVHPPLRIIARSLSRLCGLSPATIDAYRIARLCSSSFPFSAFAFASPWPYACVCMLIYL